MKLNDKSNKLKIKPNLFNYLNSDPFKTIGLKFHHNNVVKGRGKVSFKDNIALSTDDIALSGLNKAFEKQYLNIRTTMKRLSNPLHLIKSFW